MKALDGGILVVGETPTTAHLQRQTKPTTFIFQFIKFYLVFS
jgi:hypothetical protein